MRAVGKGDAVMDILRLILIEEMNLAPDRVNIFNQRFAIPTDENIFIYLECQPSTIVSNRNWTQPNIRGGLDEVQELNTNEAIIIGVFSKNLEALRRKEEVVMALQSQYSQQQQESNSFRIFSYSPINDLSVLEGSSRLYRYDIVVRAMAWYQKIKSMDYYDSYNTRVITDTGFDVTFSQPSSSSSSSSRSSSSSSSSRSSSSSSISSSSSSQSSSSQSSSSSSSSLSSSSSFSSSSCSSSSSRSSSSSSSSSSSQSSSSSSSQSCSSSCSSSSSRYLH